MPDSLPKPLTYKLYSALDELQRCQGLAEQYGKAELGEDLFMLVVELRRTIMGCPRALQDSIFTQPQAMYPKGAKPPHASPPARP